MTVDYIKVLQQELGDNIGRKVKIIDGKRKGRIEIEYYGNDDFKSISRNAFLCEIPRLI